MRPRRSSRRLAVSPACVSNCVVLLGLTISTCMLLRLALKPRGGGASLADIERAEDLLEPVSDEDFLDGDKDFIKLAKKLPDFKATMKDARGKKWRARSARVQRNASMEYPQLEGLPIYISDDNRRVKKQDIFVTKSNYDKLMAGYRDEKDMLTKSGRPTEHFKNDWLIPKRSFPDAEAEDLLGGAALRSCAVVGSSGSLLNTSMGSAIDTHDFVMRINQAPTNRKFHRHAGSRTSMRLINTRWTNKYSDFRFLEGTKDAPESSGQALPLEENVVLVVSRAKPRHFDDMVQYLRVIREDVRVLYLSSRVVSEARRLLVSYRVRLDEAHLGPYYGGSTPSTGFLGVFMLLQLCERVTVYGFGLDSEDGRMQKYHYFELFTKSAKKNEMNPTHSFDAERDLLRAMAKFNVIKYCGYVPHDHKHNKRCGAVAGLRRTSRPRPPAGSSGVHEVDLEAGAGEEEAEEPPWE
eukprot:jgi/Tetstr1/446431/TSEL_033973.t1